MGLMLGSHPSVRQFVLASRVKKKMEAAGWKPGDPKPKDFDNIPNEYLEWLSHQDGQALVLGEELDKLAKQSGIAIEPDYTHHGAELLPADVQAEIDNIEHGFKDLEEAREAEKSAPDIVRPALEKRTKEQAEKFGAHLKQVLASGVRAPEASADVESAAHTTKAANVDDAAINKIDQLQPSAQQMQEAMSLFKDTKENAKILAGAEAQAWIQSFAGLSQDQLGELLLTGKTIATTPTGKVQLQVHGETQKAFVRALYIQRMAAARVPLNRQPGELNDAQLVAAQQGYAARAEDAAEQKAALDDDAESQRGDDDASELDEQAEEEAEATGKGKGRGTGDGASVGDGAAAGAVTNAEKDGDAKAKPNDKDSEPRKQTLEDRFTISANNITAFVQFDDDGGLELTPDGKRLEGQSWDFNGGKATVDQPPEINNVRTTGAGSNKVTFFTFRLHIGGPDGGYVEQQYVIRGTKVHEAQHADGEVMLAGLTKAVAFDGMRWILTKDTTFEAGLTTLRVDAVEPIDSDELKVTVTFVSIKARDGVLSVKTYDQGEQIVHVGDQVRMRVPAPKAPTRQ
jgi:hypothetical protein